MRKLSLVNRKRAPEARDRDETETLGKCVLRPSRDRDVETESLVKVVPLAIIQGATYHHNTSIYSASSKDRKCITLAAWPAISVMYTAYNARQR